MKKQLLDNGCLKSGAALTGSALLLVLSGCDGGSATAPARDHASLGQGSSASSSFSASRGGYDRGGGYGGEASDQPDHRKDPVPLVKGEPMWAANRRHSAEDNAQYHFERDGKDFDAHSVDDYVGKAHAFVDKPPAGVQTLTRANGDRLLYDPKNNIFAVVSKDGAPRTMFKPRAGADYWAQQTQRAADQGAKSGDRGGYRSYGRRSGGGGDDGGGDG